MTMHKTLVGMSMDLARRRHIIGATLFLTAMLAGPAAMAESSLNKPETVVFVCRYGSGKSMIAAAYFNRIAKERGLPIVAVSRGITADNAIPASIRQGLASDGLVPANDIPRVLTAEEASGAVKIFAFDDAAGRLDVPNDRKGGTEVTHWADVPYASKDYGMARDAIVRHIEDIVTSLTEK
jgi:arsenate reductase